MISIKPFWALISSLLFLFPQWAGAQVECSVSDKEFLHQIMSSSDWTDVHEVFKRNIPACQDEGLYADGYSNLVVGVLAENWHDLNSLDELAIKDEAFKAFVLRHIGISAGEDGLRRVLHSAQTDCPKRSMRLCKEIARRCQLALGGRK